MRTHNRCQLGAHALGLALLVTLLSFGSAHAQGLFAPPDYYSVGADPNDVAFGDLNHDYYGDLVVANELSNSVSVLLNDGGGTFGTAEPYTVGVAPLALAITELNGDAHPDVIVSNSGSNSISVLLGNGDGTLAPAVTYPVGAEPWGIIAEKLNADDWVDVAVVNRDARTFSVLLNTGGGILDLSGSYPAGGAYINPSWLTASDFDMAISAEGVYSYSFAVVSNYGDGSFGDAFTVAVGPYPMGLATGDFDIDGDYDVAVAIEGDNTVAVTLNTTNPITGVADHDASGLVAGSLSHRSSPNPFSRLTEIEYALSSDCDVRLDVYDVLGQRVAALVNRHQKAGIHSVIWDGAGTTPGVYYYRIQAGDFTTTRKIVLIR